MNKTLTYLFLVAACAGCFSACIKEDWSDCPPPDVPAPEPEPIEGRVKLQLDYKMHNYKEGADYIDRFIEEVHKVDVFVFDTEGNFVRRDITPVDPTQPEPYTLALDYPAGDYHFVVWGNHNETENECLGGRQTPLESSAMHLRTKTPDRTIDILSDSLFHGMTPQPVSIIAGEEQTIPVGLMKNRNDIRLLVRWHEKGTERDARCTHASHSAGLEARIIDANASYSFDNQLLPAQDSVVYLGGDFTPDKTYHMAFHDDTICPPEAYKADFSVGRLMQGSRAELILTRADSIVFRRPLMEIISQAEQYKTQESLDREDRYLIELLFECEHPSEPVDPDPDPDPDKPNPDPDRPGPGPDPDPRPEPDPTGEVLISITVNGWNFIDRDVDL